MKIISLNRIYEKNLIINFYIKIKKNINIRYNRKIHATIYLYNFKKFLNFLLLDLYIYTILE